MYWIVLILILVVVLLYVYFFVLEMFLWMCLLGLKMFCNMLEKV